MRFQYTRSKPLYEKRATTVSKIADFWPLVLEEAPQEIESEIQPTDSQVFAEALTNLHVSRFELDENPETGCPKSLAITFEFKENEWFSDTKLEKRFWYRRSPSLSRSIGRARRRI